METNPSPTTETTPATAAAPTITLTLGKLAAADQALTRLAGQAAPSKTAYHIAKLVRLVGVEVKFYYERHNALVDELGEERPTTAAEQAAGHPPTVKAVKRDQVAAFNERLKELTDVEVTIPWGPIDLDAVPNLVITPADLLALGPLVKDAA